MSKEMDGCGWCGCCIDCISADPCECDEGHTFDQAFINAGSVDYTFCSGVVVNPCIGVCPLCNTLWSTTVCISFIFVNTVPSLPPYTYSGNINIITSVPGGGCVLDYEADVPGSPWNVNETYSFCIRAALRGSDSCCQQFGTIGVNINATADP